MKEFLTVSEASFYTSKSEITIRRLLSEHKNNKTDIRKINGKISIRVTFLSKYYTLKSDEQKLKSDEHEHEKQKASLILEKQNKDIINENQQIIKELINQTNKKSYSWVYIVLGFIALMAVMCGFGYLYRAELVYTYNSKISAITKNSQKEISGYEKELKHLNTQLSDTKKTYSYLIAEIKISHSKLTDNQTESISKKEKEIERLQKELDRVTRQSEIIKNTPN